MFWIALALTLSLSCFFLLRFVERPISRSKCLYFIYKITIYSGNTICWGLLYYFVISQLLEGLLYSWISIVYFPIYSKYGILSVLSSVVYLLLFGIFCLNIYLMITVCTKIEVKFEMKVED